MKERLRSSPGRRRTAAACCTAWRAISVSIRSLWRRAATSSCPRCAGNQRVLPGRTFGGIRRSGRSLIVPTSASEELICVPPSSRFPAPGGWSQSTGRGPVLPSTTPAAHDVAFVPTDKISVPVYRERGSKRGRGESGGSWQRESEQRRRCRSSAPRSGGARNSDRRMLQAAVALIGRHGTVGASLADIGVEAGYSRGLPVQRFGTKLNLLETVIDTIQDRFMRQVGRRIGGRTGCEALAERIRIQMEAVRDMPIRRSRSSSDRGLHRHRAGTEAPHRRVACALPRQSSRLSVQARKRGSCARTSISSRTARDLRRDQRHLHPGAGNRGHQELARTRNSSPIFSSTA